jgi:hypothetical protein
VTQETVRFRGGRATYLRADLHERPNSARRVDAHAQIDHDEVGIGGEVYGLPLSGHAPNFNGSYRSPAFHSPVHAFGRRYAYAFRRSSIPCLYVPDEVYERARAAFSEEELVYLTLAVSTINSWNRFCTAFRVSPDKADEVFNKLSAQRRVGSG